MGREILFRGKRKSDGEWIFGNLLQTDDDGTCIIQNHVPHHLLKNFEVDPETVCQYTGLTDKNGRKIFEGDVILFEKKKYFVVWFDRIASFVAKPFEDGRCWPCMNVGTMSVAEIISNIFDNPELLNQ